MNLRPLRGYVLVEVLESEEEVRASGIVMPESAQEKPSKGTVIAIGQPPYSGKDDPIYIWEIQVGQQVIFKKWGGQDVDEKLKLVGHNELLGVYE